MKLRPTDNHSTRSITRRVLLLGISLMVVAGLWAPVAHAQPAAPTATEQPLRPTLPAPTGHHRIGVVQLHLMDHSRPDPWVPTQTVGNSWSACGTRRSAPTATQSRRGCHQPRGPASNRTT